MALFLGAGASVPYGLPTTKQLFRDIREKHRPKPGSVLRTLLDCEFADVEYLLGAIKKMLKFPDRIGRGDCQMLSAQKQIRDPLGDVKMPRDKLLKELSKVDRMLTKDVFNALKFDEDENFLSMIQTFSTIINFLKSHSDKTTIFTTNNDCVVEKYMRHCEDEYRLVDGFKLTGQILRFRPEAFHEDYGSLPRRPVFLYKLHGSLTWAKIDRKTQRIPVESHSDDPNYQNLYIPPTLPPKDGADEWPYSVLFRLFEIEMKRTDALIVIGYSFRDTNIANAIREAFACSKKKLVIVSPDGIKDYYKNLCCKKIPQDLAQSCADVFNPNDHVLILKLPLEAKTPAITANIFARIGAFLTDKN